MIYNAIFQKYNYYLAACSHILSPKLYLSPYIYIFLCFITHWLLYIFNVESFCLLHSSTTQRKMIRTSACGKGRKFIQNRTSAISHIMMSSLPRVYIYKYFPLSRLFGSATDFRFGARLAPSQPPTSRRGTTNLPRPEISILFIFLEIETYPVLFRSRDVRLRFVGLSFSSKIYFQPLSAPPFLSVRL